MHVELMAFLPAMVAVSVNSAQADIATSHSVSVRYAQTDVESACGAHVIRIRYRNDWPSGRRGRVLFVQIDDRQVDGASQALESHAANRTVSKIEIMNCGYDADNPVFHAVMNLAPLESRQRGMPSDAYFRIGRVDGRWQLTLE